MAWVLTPELVNRFPVYLLWIDETTENIVSAAAPLGKLIECLTANYSPYD